MNDVIDNLVLNADWSKQRSINAKIHDIKISLFDYFTAQRHNY